jgi:hypothetical protein
VHDRPGSGYVTGHLNLSLGCRARIRSMEIEALRKFRGRNPRGYFEDLSWDVRQRVYAWLDKFVARRTTRFGYVPRWLFPIYVGQARRLALNPPTSSWGHKMLAKRGGFAVQRRYRAEGRAGQSHPAHHAARVSASRRRWKKTGKGARATGHESAPSRIHKPARNLEKYDRGYV